MPESNGLADDFPPPGFDNRDDNALSGRARSHLVTSSGMTSGLAMHRALTVELTRGTRLLHRTT